MRAGSWGLGAGFGSWEAGARGQELRTGGWGQGAAFSSPVVSQEAGSQALSLQQVHVGEDHVSLSW